MLEFEGNWSTARNEIRYFAGEKLPRVMHQEGGAEFLLPSPALDDLLQLRRRETGVKRVKFLRDKAEKS